MNKKFNSNPKNHKPRNKNRKLNFRPNKNQFKPRFKKLNSNPYFKPPHHQNIKHKNQTQVFGPQTLNSNPDFWPLNTKIKTQIKHEHIKHLNKNTNPANLNPKKLNSNPDSNLVSKNEIQTQIWTHISNRHTTKTSNTKIKTRFSTPKH